MRSVASAYVTLAALSALLAFSKADAWTVWYQALMMNLQAGAASAPAK